MLMKGHKMILPSSTDSIPKVAYNINKTLNGMPNGNSIEPYINLDLNFNLFKYLENIDKWNVVGVTAQNGVGLSQPVYCYGTKTLYSLLIDKLSKGKAVMVSGLSHVCVVYGYKLPSTSVQITAAESGHIEGLMGATTFFVHDPDPTHGPCLEIKMPVLPIQPKDVSSAYSGYAYDNFYTLLYGRLNQIPPKREGEDGYYGQYLAYVIDFMPESNRSLQTIHLPPFEVKDDNGKIQVNAIPGYVTLDQIKTNWNPKVPEGYLWYDSAGSEVNEITSLENITFNNIPIYNADHNSETSVSLKIVAYICNGNSTDNNDFLVKKDFYQVQLSKAQQHLFTSSDNVKFVQDFKNLLDEKYNKGEILREDFLLRVAIARGGISLEPSIIDKFDLKFNYKHQPTKIKIEFIPQSGLTEIKRNFEFNVSVSGTTNKEIEIVASEGTITQKNSQNVEDGYIYTPLLYNELPYYDNDAICYITATSKANPLIKNIMQVNVQRPQLKIIKSPTIDYSYVYLKSLASVSPPIGERYLFKHGKYQSWYETGNKWEDGVYNNDRKNSLWTEYYESGNIKLQYNYTNGAMTSTIDYYDISGRKKIEGNYEIVSDNSVTKSGVWISYYESGNVKSIENYSAGLLNGQVISKYDNADNSIFTIGQYSNGITVGHWVTYFEDGKIWSERDYSIANKKGLTSEK